MIRLDNEAFLDALTELFQSTRLKGSVTMTVKRYDGRIKPEPSNKDPPKEFMCLIRAYSENKKKKISTVVVQKDVIKFQMAYCSLLKNNIDGLKKVKKMKKTKA